MPLKPATVTTNNGASSVSLPDPPGPKPDRTPQQLEATRPSGRGEFGENIPPMASAPSKTVEYVAPASNLPETVSQAATKARNAERYWEPAKTPRGDE